MSDDRRARLRRTIAFVERWRHPVTLVAAIAGGLFVRHLAVPSGSRYVHIRIIVFGFCVVGAVLAAGFAMLLAVLESRAEGPLGPAALPRAAVVPAPPAPPAPRPKATAAGDDAGLATTAPASTSATPLDAGPRLLGRVDDT